MDIYNQDKTQKLEKVDLSLGYLKSSIKETIKPEIKMVKEQGHYEVVREYPNGGKDFKWIVDIPRVDYKPKEIVKEEILVYVPYTDKEYKERTLNAEISALKDTLRETDYVVIKMAEATMLGKSIIELKNEYKDIFVKRRDARKRINELENELTVNGCKIL